MSDIIFCNHQFLSAKTPCVQANDRGFTLGDGIFETILSYDYKIPFFDLHWQRFITSLNTLQINLPNKYNKDYLINIIHKLLNKNNISPKVWQGIKIIVTRGVSSRGLEPVVKHPHEVSFIVTCFDVQKPELHTKTLDLAINHKTNQHSALTQIKSLNYLDKILAKQSALAKNYDDALLINLDHHLCEATTSNIFFILNNNKIITPKISDGVLPGIIRQFVINTLKNAHYSITEKSIGLNNLLLSKNKVSAAFITNALIGLNTISFINKTDLNLTSNNHPVMNWLYKEFLKVYM